MTDNVVDVNTNQDSNESLGVFNINDPKVRDRYEEQRVVIDVDNPEIIDVLTKANMGVYSGKLASDLIEEYKDRNCKIMLMSEAVLLVKEHNLTKYVKPPTPITRERFEDMLDTLPPLNWRVGSTSESFMFLEALTDNIRSIFCRVDSNYYELANVETLTHADIVNICKNYRDNPKPIPDKSNV